MKDDSVESTEMIYRRAVLDVAARLRCRAASRLRREIQSVPEINVHTEVAIELECEANKLEHPYPDNTAINDVGNTKVNLPKDLRVELEKYYSIRGIETRWYIKNLDVGSIIIIPLVIGAIKSFIHKKHPTAEVCIKRDWRRGTNSYRVLAWKCGRNEICQTIKGVEYNLDWEPTELQAWLTAYKTVALNENKLC